MSIYRVTITGADDNTPISELRKLTDEFEFVEWGILIGTQKQLSRFPSLDWIYELVEERGRKGARMWLSLHVCGQPLRDIAAGNSPFQRELNFLFTAFDRVQLNWHGERQGNISENILKAFCNSCPEWDPQIIFQNDGVNTNDIWQPCSRRFICSYLFDQSHGAGVVPDEWPQCSNELTCGYAGGLGPHNLSTELPKIFVANKYNTDIWIDAETHVRTNNVLDMDKVRRFLEIAKPHIKASA